MAVSDVIDYQAEIEYFRRVRNANICHEKLDKGERAFVLVPNVTEALLKPDHPFEDRLTKLLWAAYDHIDGQAPQIKANQIHDHLPLFYALVDLDLGHRIHDFLDDNLKDLPISREKLEKLLDPENVDLFFDQQWRWCPMVFKWRNYGRLEFQEYIVPIVGRTMIEPSRDGLPKSDRKATLWIVEVPTEMVEEPIKEKLRSNSDANQQPVCSWPPPPFRSLYRRVYLFSSTASSIRGQAISILQKGRI